MVIHNTWCCMLHGTTYSICGISVILSVEFLLLHLWNFCFPFVKFPLFHMWNLLEYHVSWYYISYCCTCYLLICTICYFVLLDNGTTCYTKFGSKPEKLKQFVWSWVVFELLTSTTIGRITRVHTDKLWATFGQCVARAPIRGTVRCSFVTKFCQNIENENLETSPTLSKGVLGESLITPCWDL